MDVVQTVQPAAAVAELRPSLEVEAVAEEEAVEVPDIRGIPGCVDLVDRRVGPADVQT